MEHGKISNNIEQANTTDEDTYRKSVEKNNKKRTLFAKIGAGIVLFGTFTAAGIKISEYVQNRNNAKENTTVTEQAETTENKSNIVLEEQITSVEGVKEDFVDKYLKAYNEKYDTNYNKYQVKISVISLNEGIVYETPNGNHVTRGSNIEETQKILKEIENGYRQVAGYNEVLQILTDNKDVLGTYNASTGEFIYSGNDKKLEEKLQDSNFIEPTLEELGINANKAKNVAKVIMADGVESSDSVKARIATYQNTPDVPEEKIIEDYTR